MSTVPEDRPSDHETGSFRSSFRCRCCFLLTLGWLLVATGVFFVRGTPRRREPMGEPEAWKLLLGLTIALGAILVLAAFAPYPHLHRTSPAFAP